MKSEKGQAILVMLLLVAVILTIGLSVVSRSVTDIKISQQSQEAARVLWVAQGGLEKAMKANVAIDASEPEEIGGVKVWVSKTGFGGGPDLVFPSSVDANESITLWLVGHNENTREIDDSIYYTGSQLTFYWGNNSTCDAGSPALEATLIYEDASSKFRNKRYVYDCFSASRTPPTNFPSPNTGCSLSGQSFAFCSGAENLNLPVNSKPYLVRLRLIFNNTSQPIGVKGDKPLPTQGSCFESSAKVEESGITRKLRQCQSFSILPQVFDFLLFYGGSI